MKKLPANLNTLSALPALADALVATKLDAPASPKRARQLVSDMLDGKWVEPGSLFEVRGEDLVPRRALVKAQIAQLLAQLEVPGGQLVVADGPEHATRNLARLVTEVVERAKAEIERKLDRLGQPPDPEQLDQLAREHGPVLVLEVLATKLSLLPGPRDPWRAAMIEFAQRQGLEAAGGSLLRAQDRDRPERIIERLEKHPSPELVGAALLAGARPEALRKVARSLYLDHVRDGSPTLAAEVERCFEKVGFGRGSIGRRALEAAEAEGRVAVSRRQVAELERLFTSQGLSLTEATRLVSLARELLAADEVPRARVMDGLLDQGTRSLARLEVPGSSDEDRATMRTLRGAVVALAGPAAWEDAGRERLSAHVHALRENAIANPWHAVFPRDGSVRQGWLREFGARFDAETGEKLDEGQVARARAAIVRFWNNVHHRAELSPEVRESWSAWLRNEYPELQAELSALPPVYVDGVEVRALMNQSSYAEVEGWRGVVDFVLEGQPVESSKSDLLFRLNTLEQRVVPSVADLPRKNILSFTAEIRRLLEEARSA